MANRWWTRQENIRTFARCPFEVDLVELVPLPVYRRIAFDALEMRASGVRVAPRSTPPSMPRRST